MLVFKDLPDTSTPINATNLNGNFNELINMNFYKNGDTYSNVNLLPLSGHITGASKAIACNLTLPKRLDNITTITINSYDITVRHTGGGYILNRVTSGLTASAVKCDGVNVALTFESPNAYSATNNTPVAVAIYGINLTFN